ncbi:hypothetical protein IT418_02525 [bacterium]|nr:hypothetical protein [bacterium]
MVSMTLIAIIFLMVIQAFNSLLLGSYLIDARTAVRNESEFVGEYFKLRVKNADPRSLSCTTQNGIPKVSWQSKGSSDKWVFFAQRNDNKDYTFCIANSDSLTCEKVLTYKDVKVTDVTIECETPEFDEAQVANVNLKYTMESTAKLGEIAAVKDVSRFINVSIR